MLDQNTDRSIWMIGAVLVGVAMIILAKAGFKETFTKVMDWFGSIITDGTSNSKDVTKVTILPALQTVDWGTIATHVSTILIH